MPRRAPGLEGHKQARRTLCAICGLSSSSKANSVNGRQANPQRFTEKWQKIFKDNFPGGESYDFEDLSLPDGLCGRCRCILRKRYINHMSGGASLPELFNWPPYVTEDDFDGFCECFLCKRSKERGSFASRESPRAASARRPKTGRPKKNPEPDPEIQESDQEIQEPDHEIQEPDPESQGKPIAMQKFYGF